jgi:hypothetical protein
MSAKRKLEGIKATPQLLAAIQGKGKAECNVIPLHVVRDMALRGGSQSLNEALRVSKTSLVFSSLKEPELTPEKAKFQKRMERLRLQVEDHAYQSLTKNIQKHREDDDITTKSMTYAASVGLNMIVAPISFGVFMYFFAGQIFSWMFGEVEVKPHQTDIRRVIAGVVSGVAMLFIEMILFVIRTHTLDKSVRRKQAKKKISPFGYAKPKNIAKQA